MTLHRRISRSGARQKRALGVQAILEWAFRVEKARLELPPPKNAEEESTGFGMEYVLIQRAQLGCQIDGGRYKLGSYTHVDAEVVAATLAALPDALGGDPHRYSCGGTRPRRDDARLDAQRRAAMRAG